LALFSANLFSIEFIFETQDNSFLALSKSILLFLNSSIKSSLLFISSKLFKGLIICSFRKDAPIGVFVLLSNQNRVHIVDDFVEKLYNKSRLFIVDSSRLINQSFSINDNFCRKSNFDFWFASKYSNNRAAAA
jgi:hypothetical protein